MRVKVLFFGVLKDITGRAEEDSQFPEDVHLGGVFEHYAARFPRIREMAGSIVLARNREFAPISSPVAEGDEVAFLPPVSGGAPVHEIHDPSGHYFAITHEPIDTRSLVNLVQRGDDGAVVTFEGVVRNNTKGRATLYLDYEGYEEMAVKVMAEIGLELARTMAIGCIATIHRLGRLEIGEASVAVVVSAPHRKPAFEAALEGINRLKRLVPIWKKEYFADGEIWVEGEWDRSAPLVAGS
ncbi:MAG: molybdenum cofactor biosynthesis protein MoaE [Acidobacteriota bacterium]|nr:molybdenum cofactor biosynthesis protein MoaE [Acidobacteriota bacterium]